MFIDFYTHSVTQKPYDGVPYCKHGIQSQARYAKCFTLLSETINCPDSIEVLIVNVKSLAVSLLTVSTIFL